MSRSRLHELARLLEKSSQPVFALDDERRIVYCNEAASRWCGYPAEEMLGQESRYHSSLEVSGAAAVACALCPSPAVYSGETESTAIVARNRDDQPLHGRASYLPLAGSEQEIIGVLAIVVPQPAAVVAPDDPESATARLMHARIQRLRQQFRQRFQINHLLGDSPAISRARAQAAVAARSTASVLIVGPPGSGRERLARAIHYSQPGPGGEALVPLACSLVAGELLASTIVALSRGEAKQENRPATLLLNDVDQLPPDLQRELPPLLTASAARVRVLSTARQPLVPLAADGKYNAALAHLLSTLCIELPPLAERLADLPLLAQLFLEEANARDNKQVGRFSEEALDLLAAYPWDRNLDELDELVRQAHQRANGPEITVRDLPDPVRWATGALARPRPADETIVLEDFLGAIERELIERALARAKGNKTKAAQLLGMTRPRLYRRLVQLGLVEAGAELPLDSAEDEMFTSQ